MHLTLKNIHVYLLDKGYIDMPSLVDGDYTAIQSKTRNKIFKIIRKNKKGLFIKQLNSFDINNAYVIQKDATCQWLIKNNPSFAKLSAYVPEYLGFDPEKQVLVTEYFANAHSFRQFFFQGNFPEPIFETLTDILSAYHFQILTEMNSDRAIDFFPRQVPWILRISEMTVAEIQVLYSQSPNSNPILDSLLANNAVKGLLATLKDGWKCTSLIHGDLKWDNLLILAEDNNSIKLIDWEIADVGDPMWDVAGIFQSFIADTIQYSNAVPLQPHGEVTINDFSAGLLKILYFWKSYVRKAGISDTDMDFSFEKSLRYTGARLLQSAVEFHIIGPSHHLFSAKLLLVGYFILNNMPEVMAKMKP